MILNDFTLFSYHISYFYITLQYFGSKNFGKFVGKMKNIQSALLLFVGDESDEEKT